jgi:hypothetical protein
MRGRLSGGKLETIAQPGVKRHSLNQNLGSNKLAKLVELQQYLANISMEVGLCQTHRTSISVR